MDRQTRGAVAITAIIIFLLIVMAFVGWYTGGWEP